MSDVIRTFDLTKHFRDTLALNSLNIEIPAGAVYALVGPNGAGKTTALKVLMNIHQPTSGRAEILGTDSRRLAPRDFARIGYVSENQDLPEWMTVAQFLDYLRPFYPTWDDERCAELLRQLDLPRQQKLMDLSRGMRMKAALASSLAYRPKIILLDEPFSGLDPLVRDEAGRKPALWRGRSDRAHLLARSFEIESFASHVGYLDQGRLHFSEELTTLTARFREVEVTLEACACRARGMSGILAAPRIRRLRSPLRRIAIRHRTHARRCPPRLRPRRGRRLHTHAAARHLRRACEIGPPGRVRRNIMRQAIHIFKKDLDHLWLEIAVMIALLVALVASELTRWPDLRPLGLAGGLRALLPALISIGWFVLIARVIHAEALVGDRQFWLTRPYSRRSLGAAKAMFALAVLGLPLLLAQATILAGEGFSLRENLAALLRNQTGLLAILLPAAALAAVTADLGKMVIGTLLLYVGILVLQTAIGPMSWIGGVLLLISLVVAAAVVVWLQYSRRRTSVSRLLLGASALLAVVVGAALPSGASSAIQLWLSSERFDAASLHIGLAHRPAQPRLFRCGRKRRRTAPPDTSSQHTRDPQFHPGQHWRAGRRELEIFVARLPAGLRTPR
jgi:ABC-2 type transport system ATP-binding protein